MFTVYTFTRDGLYSTFSCFLQGCKAIYYSPLHTCVYNIVDDFFAKVDKKGRSIKVLRNVVEIHSENPFSMYAFYKKMFISLSM